MSKHKKKKKNKSQVLMGIDRTLDCTYEKLISEIQDMQLQLAAADAKARKISKKKGKKNPKFYDYEKLRRDARTDIINRMDGSDWFTRISTFLEDIAPIVVIIARLVASLILSILSITSVKVNISQDNLSKLNNVYNAAMKVAG